MGQIEAFLLTIGLIYLLIVLIDKQNSDNSRKNG